MICSNCGTQSPAGFAYCGSCGTRLAVAETAATETRRQVAVLFADVVGFTALAEKLDPEELRTVVGNLMAELSAEVYAQGGRVDMYAGDSIMATFGAPKAHENDPALACQTALGMLEKVKVIGKGELVTELRIRIGINWGEVIYGRLGTSDRFTVLGDAVNVASRLQSSAEPNTAYVSDSVKERTAHLYTFASMGEIPVKNREQPVSTFRLLGISSAPEKERGIKGKTAVWVDRERELQFLQAWFANVGEEGRFLLITGDGGVGKTRLWEEAYRRTAIRSHRLISTRCYSYNQLVPFSSLVELLRAWLDLPASSTADLVESTIRERLPSLGYPADGVEKELLILLLTGTAQGSVADMDAGVRIELLGSTLVGILNTEAAHCPLLLELDDFHWADADGNNLLLGILPHIHNCGSILISRQPLSSSSTLSSDKALHIEPLPRTEALKLVRILVGGEIEGFNRRICDVAEGNPYYIEEIIKHLANTGMLIITDDAKPRLTKPVEQIPLPPTLSAFITQKIDSCAASARIVLAALVVLESADGELLAEVSNIGDVTGALVELDKQYLIARTKDGIYRPANDLVMDTMLKSMLASDKKRLHVAVASILIGRHQRGEEHLAAIIHHLLAAGQTVEVVPWLMESGNRVLAQGALEAALGVFRQAKALFTPESDFHLRMKVTLRELQVLLDLFRAKETLAIIGAISIKECSPAESAELTVLNLLAYIRSDDLNHALKLIPLCLERGKDLTPASRAVIHLYIAQCYARTQRLDDAVREAKQSLKQAQRLADIAVAAQANNVLGVLLNQQGSKEEALRYLFKALKLRRRIGKKDEIASSLANIATAYLYLNRVKPLRKYAGQALEYAQASGDKMAEGSSLINLGVAALNILAWDEAEDYFRKAYELFDDIGVEYPKFIAELNMALIQINTGHLNKGMQILTRKRAAFKKSGELTQISHLTEILIEVYYMHGDFKQALQLLNEQLSEEHGRNEADKSEYMREFRITLEFLLGEGKGFEDSDIARASRRLSNPEHLNYSDFVPLVLAHLHGGKPVAADVLNCLHEVYKATREKREKLQLLMLQGIMPLCINDYSTAIERLKKALVQLKKAEMNYYVVIACLHLGRTFRLSGQLARATKVLESAQHALGVVGNKHLTKAIAQELAWAGGDQPTIDNGYCGQL